MFINATLEGAAGPEGHGGRGRSAMEFRVAAQGAGLGFGAQTSSVSLSLDKALPPSAGGCCVGLLWASRFSATWVS